VGVTLRPGPSHPRGCVTVQGTVPRRCPQEARGGTGTPCPLPLQRRCAELRAGEFGQCRPHKGSRQAADPGISGEGSGAVPASPCARAGCGMEPSAAPYLGRRGSSGSAQLPHPRAAGALPLRPVTQGQTSRRGPSPQCVCPSVSRTTWAPPHPSASSPHPHGGGQREGSTAHRSAPRNAAHDPSVPVGSPAQPRCA